MQANLKGITHPCPYCEKDGRAPTIEQYPMITTQIIQQRLKVKEILSNIK